MKQFPSSDTHRLLFPALFSLASPGSCILAVHLFFLNSYLPQELLISWIILYTIINLRISSSSEFVIV